jgi:hypothetical protein
MVSPANMKSRLVELENQKSEFETEIQNANQRLKWSVVGIAIGVLLLPLALYVGIPVVLIAGFMTVFYSVKKSSFEDKLETLESEIHKLEISLA